MSVIEKGAVKRDKRRMISNEQRKAEDELCIKKQRAKFMKIQKVITPKEQKMKLLQEVSDIQNNKLDEFLASIQRKPEESETLFDKACKDTQETAAVIKELFEKRRPIQRELNKIYDALNRNMWYITTLFKLSLSERQSPKGIKTLKAKDEQKEQKSEPEGTADSKDEETGLAHCPEKALSSTEDPLLPSCRSDTEVTEPNVERDSDENEEKLDMYFSEPQQVMDLLMELIDQVLSLIHNSTEVDKMLEETIEITINKMKEDDEKLTIQVNDMKDRIKGNEKRASMLKMMVQVHDSLKTEDQDVLLVALGKNVREVHAVYSYSHLTNLSTLEKLCSVEHHMALLLHQIENIPEEMCKALWQIKENERKNRLREEKLRLEREKQHEKMHKCMQRAHGDVTKSTGRKLMPRSMLVKQKVINVEEPVAATVEEVPYSDFFDDS